MSRKGSRQRLITCLAAEPVGTLRAVTTDDHSSRPAFRLPGPLFLPAPQLCRDRDRSNPGCPRRTGDVQPLEPPHSSPSAATAGVCSSCTNGPGGINMTALTERWMSASTAMVAAALVLPGCSDAEADRPAGASVTAATSRSSEPPPTKEQLKVLAFKDGEAPQAHSTPVQDPGPKSGQKRFPPVTDASCQRALDVLGSETASAFVRGRRSPQLSPDHAAAGRRRTAGRTPRLRPDRQRHGELPGTGCRPEGRVSPRPRQEAGRPTDQRPERLNSFTPTCVPCARTRRAGEVSPLSWTSIRS